MWAAFQFSPFFIYGKAVNGRVLMVPTLARGQGILVMSNRASLANILFFLAWQNYFILTWNSFFFPPFWATYLTAFNTLFYGLMVEGCGRCGRGQGIASRVWYRLCWVLASALFLVYGTQVQDPELLSLFWSLHVSWHTWRLEMCFAYLSTVGSCQQTVSCLRPGPVCLPQSARPLTRGLAQGTLPRTRWPGLDCRLPMY